MHDHVMVYRVSIPISRHSELNQTIVNDNINSSGTSNIPSLQLLARRATNVNLGRSRYPPNQMLNSTPPAIMAIIRSFTMGSFVLLLHRTGFS